MKTNFNHIGSPVALAAVALINLLLHSTALAQSEKSSVEPVSIRLCAGVTGAEVQRALDDLPAAGGEVVLPVGEISIRQPLVLCRDAQTLRGAGASTILRLADDANCPVIILGEPVNHPSRVVRDLCVRDLFIDGNRTHQQRELWKVSGEGSYIRNNGITIQAVSDSSVLHVVSARCRSGGLVTTLGVQNLTVRGLEAFDNEFDGLACYLTTNSLFTDLYLHDNPGAGISLDLAFNHNVISNAVLNSNDLGIFMRASRNNKFLNVNIQDSHNFGVFMAHAEQATTNGVQPAPRTECAHNDFTNLMAANCGNAAFRVNNSTCTDNVITRPQFAGNLKGGLSLAQPNLVTIR